MTINDILAPWKKLRRNCWRIQSHSRTPSTARDIICISWTGLLTISSFSLGLFTSGAGFATHFSTIFHPISGEYDLIGKNPDAAQTIRSVSKYETAMEELRSAVGPELELIESRIVGPTKELQQVMKTIRKSITKRDHKVRPYLNL